MPQVKTTPQAHKIWQNALQIVADSPGGIRYSKLVESVAETMPGVKRSAVAGAVWNLDQRFPERVQKPARGLFAPPDAGGPIAAQPPALTQPKQNEEAFYGPLAEWLREEGEVTVATPLGGAPLKEKWGSPDVIGVYKPLANNLVKFPVEIIAAEVKIDPQASVVAFGQAVAYRLFATKSLIAMPRAIGAADQARLEALCMLFGVGLVLFDLCPSAPAFSTSVRASRASPDMFYVNEFARRLNEHDPKLFNSLFAV
jgi:hypothetical protein